MQKTIRLAGFDVPRIGLGTNRLTSEKSQFVRDAHAAGIRHFDTAHVYTQGQSESAIGEALPATTTGVLVATKGGIGGPGGGQPDVLRAEIEESLRRLRRDRIDLYYLHRVDPQTPLEVSLGAIKEYVDRGQIAHVGVSAVTVEQIERARKVVPIAAVQNEYSLAKRENEDVIDHCEREGIVFVPYFPLRGEAAAADEIGERRGLSTTQVKLAWLLRRSPAMLPIPGTLTLDHARQNLAALDVELSDEEFAAISS